MSDFAVDPATGDLLVSGGDIPLVFGRDAIRQDLLGRLRTIKGEWYQDQRVGVPYYDEVFDRPEPQALRAIFSKAILTTPGIVKLVSLSFDRDEGTGDLTVSGEATTVDGDTIVLDHEELVL